VRARREQWFEISDEGLVRRARERPLGRLLLEAVQNALDAGASNVSLELGAEEIVVLDDAPRRHQRRAPRVHRVS
jgi:uncharacterized protein (DUF924 family)